MSEKIILSNGIEIPQMLISTNRLTYMQILNSISVGIDSGFTGFDTAPGYKTEFILGKAIAQLIEQKEMNRKDFFIIDKVDNLPVIRNEGNILPLVKSSLNKLQIDYIDLLLMHWPTPNYFIKTWKSMEKIYEQGKAKAIGICNFRERHLLKLLNADIGICPMVAQIELHPLRTVEKLVDLHNKYNIVTQSYTPLCRMIDPITKAEIIENMSQKYHKTKAQIILRWHVQNGYIPVFKTQNLERLKENLNVFDFQMEEIEMASISALNIDYKYHIESVLCPGF